MVIRVMDKNLRGVKENISLEFKEMLLETPKKHQNVKNEL